MVIFLKVSFRKLLDYSYVGCSFLNIDQAYWQQRFESHTAVEDFTNMDQDMHLFFHQDLSKHHETKIDEGVWKIISYIKVRVYASKKIAPK